jgi:hypothetical protein
VVFHPENGFGRLPLVSLGHQLHVQIGFCPLMDFFYLGAVPDAAEGWQWHHIPLLSWGTIVSGVHDLFLEDDYRAAD